MIRNLKALVVAATVSAAFAVVGASAAQGAEFRCNQEPCTYTLQTHGTGSKSHHVLIIKQGLLTVPATCKTIEGHGTAPTITNQLTITGIKYGGCSVGGSEKEVEVKMNSCHYQFTNGGSVHIKGCAGGFIELIKEECIVSIGEQTAGGMTYKTIGATPTREVTVETKLAGLTGTANNKCGGIGLMQGAVTVDYTTGNALLTGETAAGVMADAWFE